MSKFLPKSSILFTIFLTCILYLVSCISPANIFADYQSARNDYVYQYSQYRTALSRYQVAKSAYMTYGTITSQNEAIGAFRAVIQTRDQVISTYYNLLQEKLNATVGVSPEYRATFAEIKTNEKKWLADHQIKIDAAASLEDLNSAAREFEQHFPQFDVETKQAVGTVLLTKIANLKIETDAGIATLSGKVSEIRQSGQDTSLWDRGMINVNNKLDLYDQKYTAAHDVFFPQMGGTPGSIDMNQGRLRLTEANQYLRETLTYLAEIVRSITG